MARFKIGAWKPQLLAALSASGLLLALFAWALSSPVGSSPDDDFHLVSIWCSAEKPNNMCDSTQSTATRNVNSALIDASCFKHNSKTGGECQAQLRIFEDVNFVQTSHGNFAGHYPQLFYSTMNTFATSDIRTSVISMRFFNATLFVAIVSALWVLLPRILRSTMYFSVALTLVPLGLFFIPSVNPSSWTITATFAAIFGTAGALGHSGKHRIALWGFAAIGLLLALGSRYDGFFYALIGIAFTFAAYKRFRIPRKPFWIGAATAVLLSSVALLLGGANFLFELVTFAGSNPDSAERSAFGILAINLASLTQLWAGFSGAMGIGWLDTVIPPTSWMLAAALVWGTLISRLDRLRNSQLWLSIAALALLAIVPLATLQIGNSVVGENVQSRYIFPLFILLVSLVLLNWSSGARLLGNRQIMAIVFGLFISQALALYTNLIRYISGTGASGSSWNLNQAAVSGWWWIAGPAPMTVLGCGVLGFGLFLCGAFLFYKRESITDNKILG